MSQLSWRQISPANFGFAFPEKILMPPVVLIKIWLGRVDSNQRMPVPKTGALPLGYGPVSDCRFLRERKKREPRRTHCLMILSARKRVTGKNPPPILASEII